MDTSVSPRSWLILLPQLPAKPAYLRVKLQRRMQQLGASLIKNGVYVLPLNADNSAASERLREQLVHEKGELVVFGSVLCAGLTDDELQARFEPGKRPRTMIRAGLIGASAPPDTPGRHR